MFPEFHVPGAEIGLGFEALAAALQRSRWIAIDGVAAVAWDGFVGALVESWTAAGVSVESIDCRSEMKPRAEIEKLIEPYLGGQDPLFGTRCDLPLAAFFAATRPPTRLPQASSTPCIVVWFGPGSALIAPEQAELIYVEVPKNEEQFRARVGGAINLGATSPGPPQAAYKRAYFVDWPVLKRHKHTLLRRVNWYVDAQTPDQPTFMRGDRLRDALARMSRGVWRPRPWFEPGPWGGQWLKARAREACASDPENLAWSFELIAPENGIVVSDGRVRCEIALEWLLNAHGREVLGFGHEFFENEFPIRFDLLDTLGGGNLSLQCHPRPEYIVDHFGERFTQDETYYILDCDPEARVYLGFQAGVDPAVFREALSASRRSGCPVDVDRFVQQLPARKHDLFLIPHGTVHCSGAGNVVLEISATPYIFTFKLYDWLRLDLEGRPRPLNIERAFDNLNFDRRGAAVEEELVSRPHEMDRGPGWRRDRLPTHPDHFYCIDRYALEPGGEVRISAEDSPQVLMVVEGAGVEVRSEQQPDQRLAYAETFVVSAAAGSFRLANASEAEVLVVAASLKPRAQWPAWMRKTPDASR